MGASGSARPPQPPRTSAVVAPVRRSSNSDLSGQAGRSPRSRARGRRLRAAVFGAAARGAAAAARGTRAGTGRDAGAADRGRRPEPRHRRALGTVGCARRDRRAGLPQERRAAPRTCSSRACWAGSSGRPQQIDSTLAGPSSQPVIAAGNGGVLLLAFINGGALYVVQALSASQGFSAPGRADRRRQQPLAADEQPRQGLPRVHRRRRRRQRRARRLLGPGRLGAGVLAAERDPGRRRRHRRPAARRSRPAETASAPSSGAKGDTSTRAACGGWGRAW